MNDMRYRLNEPDVSTEDFRSEILAVNLKNGHYHSLQGAGVAVWRLLMDGRDIGGIVDLLAPHYQCDPNVLSTDVTRFVGELERVELIVPTTDAHKAESSGLSWQADLSPEYRQPVMETYTEMQDLLMLDPIHDVDVQGWPHAAPVDQKNS